MKIKMPYGKGFQEIRLNQENLIGVVRARDYPPVADEQEAVQHALDNPIGTKRLYQMVKPDDHVVIVINDITRPTPSKLLVGALADQLQQAGVSRSRIKLVVATGSHRPNTVQELEAMLGEEIVSGYRVENHLCSDDRTLKFIGNTKSGMPVVINRTVAEADIRILTGVIVPHHTAGFSGGRKSIVPGVSGIQTLKLHHSLPIRPFMPAMGEMESNRFHQESLEAAKMVGVDFILNVVQNQNKETVAVVAGDLEEAHRRGVEVCREMSEVVVPEPPDIVITSPGGYPRDINLYQAQKAVSPAEKIIKDNGVIILVAECKNGIEKSNFPLWMKQAGTPREIIDRFRREGFSVGSNKAFMFARALTKCKIIVVTGNITDGELEEMFMLRAGTAQEALDTAFKMMGKDSRVLVMENANSIIPRLQSRP